jgi:IS5 family transposase
MLQAGFFDLEDLFKKIDEKDQLVALNALIDWEAFRPVLKGLKMVNRKSNSGRKRKDIVMMFKGLVLQHLHSISDDELEFQIRDRYSFCGFLGL